MKMKRSIRAVAAVLVAWGGAALGGCDLVAGIGTYCEVGVDPGCGTGATGGTTGTGGSGGTGGGPECLVPSQQPCYSGPVATEGVGICASGTQTCQANGTWGACSGEQIPLVEDCSKPADEDCNWGVGCSESLWGKLFGDGSNQTVTDVVFDGQGNIVVVGTFSGTLNLGGADLISAGDDVFVAKLDPDGNHLWSHRYGDALKQVAIAVDVDSGGNVVLGGSFDGSMDVDGTMLSAPAYWHTFIVKLDANGALVWARQFGDTDYHFMSDLVINKNDEIILAGDFGGTLDIDGKSVQANAGDDGFMAKLSSNGAGLWVQSFAGSLVQQFYAIRVDKAGNIVATGWSESYASLGPACEVPAASAFVARFDGAGTCSWVHTFKPGGLPLGLAVDKSGDVIVAMDAHNDVDVGGGTITTSGADVVLVKYGSGGNYQWASRVGGSGNETGARVVVDTEKRISLAFQSDGTVKFGTYDLVSGGGSDVLLASFDPVGAFRWAKRYGLIGEQTQASLSVGPNSELALGCFVSGDVDFTGRQVLSSNGGDVGLAKIAP